MVAGTKVSFDRSSLKEIAEAYAIARRIPTDRLICALCEVSGQKQYAVMALFEGWWLEINGEKKNPYAGMRRAKLV